MPRNTATREMPWILVTARDGVRATVYHPSGSPQAVLLVHSATATPQGFYRAFAEHAAHAGFIVVTYDYRGTGLSGDSRANRRLRMRDWIGQDVPAVARWAVAHYPHLPHYAIGHSLGGHSLLLNEGTAHLKAAIIVASHVASARSIRSRRERLRVQFVLNGLGPLLCAVCGYMPGSRLGLGEDIPSAALREWGGWIRKPNYFFDDPSMNAAQRSAQTQIPLLVVGAGDDPWASPAPMDEMVTHLHATKVERRTVTPGELGVPQIGHHGLLRRGIGEGLWDEFLDWLRRH